MKNNIDNEKTEVNNFKIDELLVIHDVNYTMIDDVECHIQHC